MTFERYSTHAHVCLSWAIDPTPNAAHAAKRADSRVCRALGENDAPDNHVHTVAHVPKYNCSCSQGARRHGGEREDPMSVPAMPAGIRSNHRCRPCRTKAMLTTDWIPSDSSQASHTTCTHKAESTAEPRSILHVHVASNVACVAFNGVRTHEHAVHGANRACTALPA
jgi:hypothetical protein